MKKIDDLFDQQREKEDKIAAFGELLDDMKAVGLRRDEIDMVVMTHLHRDHVGWNVLSEGGAYVNNTKITDPEWQPADADLLHGRWLVVRRGKKTYILVGLSNDKDGGQWMVDIAAAIDGMLRDRGQKNAVSGPERKHR